jgi:hypothetical protein
MPDGLDGRLDARWLRGKWHTPEQVVRKLARADRMLDKGKDVADVCRDLGWLSRRITGRVTSSAG